MNRENQWKSYTDSQLKELMALAEDYKKFMTSAKTERECVEEAVRLAEKAGCRNLEDVIAKGESLKAGDRVYAVWMKKTMALFTIGRQPLEKGMRILGAHIDSPRLDLKQNPLYEDTEMAYLDLHYYGGIKKYQWTAIPLAIHGVVAKKDGSLTEVVIGEKEEDPVFCVTDLLIHLAAKQMEKPLAKGVEGENLDLLIGSRPLVIRNASESDCAGKENASDSADAGKEKAPASAADLVKKMVLQILEERYGMEEEDFLSAELEVVPAGPARDLGLDRSMVAAYGQDDRVCAYKLLNCCGDFSELKLRRCLAASRMLSSDVSAAYDPLYAEAYEKRNSAYFGRGIVFNKYTGARGKSGSNDANAEYVGWIRRAMDDRKVAFQTAELGRVDVGGGGTIAYISAAYGMNVVDAGVAVLNMHAPMEVTSKADIYEARNAYIAFLEAQE